MVNLLWIALALVGIVVVYVIYAYNRLIILRNRIRNAWSQIDVQLKRRNDLIPNLVETIKGYAKHEKTLLENLTRARAALLKAKAPQAMAKADNMISDTLKSLFAVSENYPQLKANENFLQLQEELSGTESKIAYSRQFYNDSVLDFNNMLQRFPTNMIGKQLGFGEKEFFKAPEGERKTPKVSF